MFSSLNLRMKTKMIPWSPWNGIPCLMIIFWLSTSRVKWGWLTACQSMSSWPSSYLVQPPVYVPWHGFLRLQACLYQEVGHLRPVLISSSLPNNPLFSDSGYYLKACNCVFTRVHRSSQTSSNGRKLARYFPNSRIFWTQDQDFLRYFPVQISR